MMSPLDAADKILQDIDHVLAAKPIDLDEMIPSAPLAFALVGDLHDHGYILFSEDDVPGYKWLRYGLGSWITGQWEWASDDHDLQEIRLSAHMFYEPRAVV